MQHYSNTFKLLILIFAAVICVFSQTGYAQAQIAVSLKHLQTLLVQSKAVTTILPQITEPLGIIIDDQEDLLLIGNSENDSEPLGLETLIIALRAAFVYHQPPGAICIGGLSPDASITTLVYAGGIEKTVVGDFFADSLKRLHSLGESETNLNLEGYWPYGNLPKVKLWISPVDSGYAVSPDEKMMILTHREVMILPRETEIDEIDPKVKEWMDQIFDRYDHLGGIFPELDRLKKFINLYKIFYWAQNHGADKENWRFLLEDYQLPSRYTPSFFRFNNGYSIAGGISCGLKARTSRTDQQLNQLKQRIMVTRNAEPDALFWQFQSPSPALKSKDWEIKQIIDDSKTAGLYGQSVFLNLETKNQHPSLSVLHNDLFYHRPSKTARQFNRLIRQTLQSHGDYQTPWKKFYQNEMSLFANNSSSEQQDHKYFAKPLLILSGDNITDEWIFLNKVEVIRNNFLLFFAPLKEKDNWKSASKRFLSKMQALPAINGSDFAIAIQIPDSQFDQYRTAIQELQKILPDANLLINPSIKDFKEFLVDNTAPIRLLNLNLSNKEIRFKDGKLSYRDIFKFKKMHHLKAIISISQGTGWGHHIYKVMQTKGAGLVSILPSGTFSQKELIGLRIYLKKMENKAGSILFLSPGFTRLFGESLGWERIP